VIGEQIALVEESPPQGLDGFTGVDSLGIPIKENGRDGFACGKSGPDL
jgi:hypothetical protein